MKEKREIKKYAILLIIAIIFVSGSIYMAYKNKKDLENNVYAYVATSYFEGYIYDKNGWRQTKDMGFLEEKKFNVYKGSTYQGVFWAKRDDSRFLLNFYNDSFSYKNTYGMNNISMIGIDSNQSILTYPLSYREVTTNDLTIIKKFLRDRKITYQDSNLDIKVADLDVNADKRKENVYIIKVVNDNYQYHYIIINDNSKIETIYIKEELLDELNQSRKIAIFLVSDIDLDERAEFFIKESGYEYTKILFYANQYGAYKLIEEGL